MEIVEHSDKLSLALMQSAQILKFKSKTVHLKSGEIHEEEAVFFILDF